MRCCFKLLLILLLHHRLDLQRQTEQVDEARGILVAVQVVAVAEGGDFLHVQAVRRLHARIDAVALVQLQLHRAVDRLLRAVHKCGERLAQGRVPHAVVHQLRELARDQLL